tara:strand:- start:2210 stop:2968 length:759 start_codon:yes stop_codon:yes gene_type:complete
MKYYTNPSSSDGFGAIYQLIIFYYLYIKINNLNYCYTPFKKMLHNYDNDENFENKLENLINFKNNFKINNNELDIEVINHRDVYKLIQSDIDLFTNNIHMEHIKNIFRENKNVDFFKNNKLNVAVHIRRPSPKDDTRIDGTDTPDRYFLDKIKHIRENYNNLLFHIYSEGNINNFKEYINNDVILHINENIVDTFTGMVFADILIMSRSSFSYAAALISNGIIYYNPFWHPKKKNGDNIITIGTNTQYLLNI